MMQAKKIILISIFVILIISIVLLIIRKNINTDVNATNTETNNSIQTVTERYTPQAKTEEQLKQEKLKALSNMPEGERMKTYFSDYMKLVEKREYDKAYEMIYPEFKNVYFPTVNEFVDYVEKTYPKEIAVEYDNIQSQGYLYILTVIMDDVDNPAQIEEEKLKQSFIFDEKGLDDYKLSFSIE